MVMSLCNKSHLFCNIKACTNHRDILKTLRYCSVAETQSCSPDVLQRVSLVHNTSKFYIIMILMVFSVKMKTVAEKSQ